MTGAAEGMDGVGASPMGSGSSGRSEMLLGRVVVRINRS